MRELVGRLTALDPEASETLKVVSYFDTLVAGGVGLETLLRGAAALSGVVAGARTANGMVRVDPAGDGQAAAIADPSWISHPTPNGSVWLERVGAAHANDEMVIERLALAVALVETRRGAPPESALHVALDADRQRDERIVALTRLRFDPATPVRVVVRPASAPSSVGPSTVIITSRGLVRAWLLAEADLWPPGAGPAGIGSTCRADDAPRSFASAVLALRLCDDETPVTDAAALGVLLDSVRVLEPVAATLPDVLALSRLDARSRQVLAALVAADSVRAAAAALGMHHSTIQARREAFTRELGYDPRLAVGRARCELAALLLRLVESR